MLDVIKIDRKNGNEKFLNTKPLSLRDYWSWAHSDVIGNAERGKLAEYLVAIAFDLHEGIRTEWDSYDLLTKDGIKIEVKSSGYIQTWTQKKLSDIRFGIQPTQAWNPETGEYINFKERQSDVYIFCVHKHQDQATINPLDISQWDFYSISTEILNDKVLKQKTITLSSLIRLGGVKVDFDNLAEVACNIYKNKNFGI